jgi:hypothetical protein
MFPKRFVGNSSRGKISRALAIADIEENNLFMP